MTAIFYTDTISIESSEIPDLVDATTECDRPEKLMPRQADVLADGARVFTTRALTHTGKPVGAQCGSPKQTRRAHARAERRQWRQLVDALWRFHTKTESR